MIKFKKVSSKNFLTVGDNPIEIILDKSTSTAITGKNGVGKSSLTSESISFALFGKSFRGINKAELVNTTNRKGTLVVCEFAIGQTEYKVSRGIKPDVFTIEKAGKSLPEVAVSEMQTILDGILGFDHAMFCSSIALGYANYVPFMEMTKAQRRQFVEDALGLSIFADMNKIIKAQSSAHNAVVADINTKITKLESYIEATEDSNKLAQQSIDGEIAVLNEEVAKIVEVVTGFKKEATEIRAKIDAEAFDENLIQNLRTQITEMQSEFVNYDNKGKLVKKTIMFYETNAKCPTCHTDMTEEHRNRHIRTCKEELEEIGETVVNIHDNINGMKGELEKATTKYKLVDGLEKQLQQINAKVSQEVSRAKYLKSEVDRKKNSTATIVDTTKHKESLQWLSGELDAALVKQEEYKLALELLKDSGIKASVVENFLPTLNNKINQLLDVIGFGVRIQFDNEFQESLIGRYADEFSYKSLSQGERERMNLAIIFAWNALMGANGANTSLMILDEIGMSALDADGVQSLFRLIDSEYSDKNVFVISHNPEVVHQCRSHIKFAKKDGFARIVD
jgi:DNA repair exonuclease SbcCD ATPase subunit